ncbi:MAG: hypothetical protein SF052_22340 [Bacteroidia bacterium]|nr:hypothetical protein [Bacteroidia bacterium]
MAYKQFTSCVKPSNYVDLSFTSSGVLGILGLLLTVGIAAFLGIALLGGPTSVVIVLALVVAAITYLEWWLNGRLICLNEADRNCAIIGMVLGAGPSDPLSKSGDNDFTMNLMLAPGPTDLDQPKEAYWNAPQGHLVQRNASVISIGRGYAPDDDDHVKYLKHLHCEFEGSGIHDLLLQLYTLVLPLTVALLFPTPFSWILAILFFLVALFYYLSTIFADQGGPGSGNPLDIDPNLGTLTGRDVVVIKGEWIYDSLHIGWNEIHPVRACQIIGYLKNDGAIWAVCDRNTDEVLFTLDSPEKVEELKQLWCNALNDAEDAETGGSRENPENDWGIHPSVDGCRPTVIIT